MIMGHRLHSTVRRRGRPARLIATALIVRDARLLLAQLARGRFAGFWLLPSATVEDGTVAETAQRMVPERTGFAPTALTLRGVQEEPHAGVLAERFVFGVDVALPGRPHADGDIARVAWLAREGVRELLAEREVVPTLGVLHLLRQWADGGEVPPLTTLTDDAPCPCGSGFGYPGCCGWDAS